MSQPLVYVPLPYAKLKRKREEEGGVSLWLFPGKQFTPVKCAAVAG